MHVSQFHWSFFMKYPLLNLWKIMKATTCISFLKWRVSSKLFSSKWGNSTLLVAYNCRTLKGGKRRKKKEKENEKHHSCMVKDIWMHDSVGRIYSNRFLNQSCSWSEIFWLLFNSCRKSVSQMGFGPNDISCPIRKGGGSVVGFSLLGYLRCSSSGKTNEKWIGKCLRMICFVCIICFWFRVKSEGVVMGRCSYKLSSSGSLKTCICHLIV